MKTQITHLKLARYPELVTGPVRPIHWDVDPSSVCDHACRGCPYIYDGPIDPMLGVVRPETVKARRTFLNFNRWSLFLEEAVEHGCKAITFVGGGEPTLHPHFVDMMDETHASGVKFGVITHLGRKYGVEFFDALARATWVRVSVNAGSREMYLRHQNRDHFDQAIANMATAAGLGTRIGMSFLITEDNHEDIIGAAEIAKKAGAKFIQYKPIIEVKLGAAYAGIYEAVGYLLAAAKKHETDDFQVIDQWSSRLIELDRHSNGEFSGPCHVQRFNPKLGANGVVYTCCELAYSDEGSIGNIYDEPLAAILQKAGTTCIEMSKCPHCWDKPLNQLINDGKLGEVSPPPKSVDQEFV